MTNPTVATILFLISVLMMLFIGAPLQGWHPQYGLIASELICIALPALVAIGLLRSRTNFAPIRSFGLNAPGVVWVVVTSALLGFAANALTGVLSVTVPGLAELAAAYEQMFQELMFPGNQTERIAAIVAIVVAAPLCEEFLFRGVMLPLQRDSALPVAVAIGLNATLFSLLHLNPLSFVALIIVGAFFAHLVVLTRSLWPSVIAHATLNLANGVLAPYVLQNAEAAAEPTLTEYLLATVLLAPIVAASWWIGARLVARSREHPDA